MTERGTVVTVRLYLAGTLADETSIRIGAGARDAIGDLGAYHGEMARVADEQGVPYMIELVFPDGEHVRWGTDASGMVIPFPIGDLAAALARLYETSGSTPWGAEVQLGYEPPDDS
jgi:hypothetical protein